MAETNIENPSIITPITENTINENKQFIDTIVRRIADLEQTIQSNINGNSDENPDDNCDGKLSWIEIVRHSMRPFMTVWFSMSYVALIFAGLYSEKINPTEAMITLGTILTTILGYCFGKSSAIDLKQKTIESK